MQRRTAWPLALVAFALIVGLIAAVPLSAAPPRDAITLDPAESAPEVVELTAAEVAAAEAVAAADPRVIAFTGGRTYTFDAAGAWDYAEESAPPHPELVYKRIGATLLIHWSDPVSYTERSWPVVWDYYPPSQLDRPECLDYCPPYSTGFVSFAADQVTELEVTVDLFASEVIEIQPGPDSVVTG